MLKGATVTARHARHDELGRQLAGTVVTGTEAGGGARRGTGKCALTHPASSPQRTQELVTFLHSVGVVRVCSDAAAFLEDFLLTRL